MCIHPTPFTRLASVLPGQVVIIAVYSYFGCEILASQFLEVSEVPGEAAVDFVVPVFSIFYFLFLMGWLKVCFPTF